MAEKRVHIAFERAHTVDCIEVITAQFPNGNREAADSLIEGTMEDLARECPGAVVSVFKPHQFSGFPKVMADYDGCLCYPGTFY
jgi:hypothetical protein